MMVSFQFSFSPPVQLLPQIHMEPKQPFSREKCRVKFGSLPPWKWRRGRFENLGSSMPLSGLLFVSVPRKVPTGKKRRLVSSMHSQENFLFLLPVLGPPNMFPTEKKRERETQTHRQTLALLRCLLGPPCHSHSAFGSLRCAAEKIFDFRQFRREELFDNMCYKKCAMLAPNFPFRAGELGWRTNRSLAGAVSHKTGWVSPKMGGPKWKHGPKPGVCPPEPLTLVSGNMDQNLGFAPPEPLTLVSGNMDQNLGFAPPEPLTLASGNMDQTWGLPLLNP